MAKKALRKKSKSINKKPKSPNLVIPILSLATIATLGLAYYFARPSAMPVGINEVAGSESNCAQVAFTDNFDEAVVDSDKWLVEINQENENALIKNGKLELSSPLSNPVMRVLGVPQIFGDFASEIDIYTPSSSTVNEPSQYAQFVFREPTSIGNYAGLARDGDGKVMTYVVGGYYGDKGISSYTKYLEIDKNLPVRARIVRQGTKLSIYYKASQGYVLLAEYPDIAGPEVAMIPRINLGPIDGTPIVASTATFDRYSISCLPPKATGLSHTCSADGTKVTLKWDNTSPSGKYHFALDDLKESDDDWFKAGTTDVWRGGDYAANTYELPIIAGREYKWWVNTNLDYTTKSETVSKYFTCDPKPPVPANPRLTCSPDGTSVKFSWDSMSDVESYKLRLDDKNGKVTNFDNIKDLQKVVAITPGKMYSWWIHSHKGNYDSNQSTAVDFTCKNTVSPTPKPTVKPTPTPTKTPVVEKPVTTTEFDKLTNPSYVPTATTKETTKAFDIPVEQEVPAPPAPKSGLARFFTWLASLFE